MIYTVSLNPALDKTVQSEGFAVGRQNRVQTVQRDPGGKGINVSRALAVLGQKSILLGVLGGETGDFIADRLRGMGFDCDFTDGRTETRTNLKIVDPGTGTLTELDEPGGPLGEAVLETVHRKLLHEVARGDTVVFSGSLPPEAPPGLYRDWIADCKKAGAYTVLDTGGEALALGLEAAPDLVKPNRDELQSLCGRRLQSIGEAAAAADGLLQKGVRTAVVSLGAEGALLMTRDTTLYGKAPKIEALSTVGAGDTMVAMLLYARATRLTPAEALQAAIAAGSAKSVRRGTEPPLMPDIQALLPRVTVIEL